MRLGIYLEKGIKLGTAEQQSVATGTAAALSALSGGKPHGVMLRAVCGSGQKIYISGDSGVTTSTGHLLADGDTLTLAVRDITGIYAIADASGAKLHILPLLKSGA